MPHRPEAYIELEVELESMIASLEQLRQAHFRKAMKRTPLQIGLAAKGPLEKGEAEAGVHDACIIRLAGDINDLMLELQKYIQPFTEEDKH